VSDEQLLQSRRNALKCMAYGGAGTLVVLAGGVFSPADLALAADDKLGTARLGKPLFVQISDTHIGFNKEANPDVNGTLTQTIDIVNMMAEQPALIIHTGDITHLSKPAEFDLAQQLLSRLRATELHTLPGEHDTTDPTVTEYFNRFGKASDNKPKSLTVKAGSSVTWVNMDDEPHSVVSDTGLFRSGAVDTNETFSFKFDKPSTYPYHCAIHPRMVATIIVQ
jgi:plastocyanin